MSGIDDLMAESNDRWATAKRRADGIVDNGLGKAVRAYYTIYLPTGLVVLVALGTLGGMLAFGGDPADWSSYLMYGFALAALGVAIGGFIYNAKKVRPAAELGRFEVLISLKDHEQKHVRRQILGKIPIDPRHLTVTRGAAVQLRKNLATQLILAPMLAFVFIAQAFPGGSSIWWLMALLTCGYAVSVAFLAREFRQTGQFLAQTASQTASSDA